MGKARGKGRKRLGALTAPRGAEAVVEDVPRNAPSKLARFRLKRVASHTQLPAHQVSATVGPT
jgi:hypothetical protein